MDKIYFRDKILLRLEEEKENLIEQFSKNPIKSFVIDDLLPEEETLKINEAFPKSSDMKLWKNIKEHKLTYDKFSDNILKEITLAFQDTKVLNKMSEITGIKELLADDTFYAAGLSKMEEGHFLNPHLDNSHNGDRKLYRVLNLLFYVTPDRKEEDGGNLELWDNGLKEEQRTIHSKFNRLAIMITNKTSLHSVSKVTSGSRCCVSNYYFAEKPLTEESYFHVTSFRGFPDQKITDSVLKVDTGLRMMLRKVLNKESVK